MQGLRILARMIIRAHLASLVEEDAKKNGSSTASTTSGDNPAKEGDSAG